MEQRPKRFANWEDIKEYVNCNNCQSYWDGSCDPPAIGSTRGCKAFKATRDVNYEAELKTLQKGLERAQISIVVMYVAFFVLAVAMCFLHVGG